MAEERRYRIDDLRRFALALTSAAGFSASRCSSFVSYLLWFDAMGAVSFGIQTLPNWLARFENQEFDTATSGVVTMETLGTAVLDGRRGVPPLVLERAGELATEKARDAGLGVVRVSNLSTIMGPAAPIVSSLATGPLAGLICGPEGRYAAGLPAEEGPPAVFDSLLESDSESARTKKGNRSGKTVPSPSLRPWMAALIPEGDWLVFALRIDAVESLSTFLERAGVVMNFENPTPGQLIPTLCEANRRVAREQGITLPAHTCESLVDWARRWGVESPI